MPNLKDILDRREFLQRFVTGRNDLIVPEAYSESQGESDTYDSGSSISRRRFLPLAGTYALAGKQYLSEDNESFESPDYMRETCKRRDPSLDGNSNPIGPRILEIAREEDLSVLRNKSMVDEFFRNGLLVQLDRSHPHFYVSGVPRGYSVVRPWTRLFVERLAKQYHDRFGKRLKITSATRDTKYQQRLRGNATRSISSHQHGNTVDISRNGMSCRERNWFVDNQVLTLQNSGLVEAVVENNNATHVAVRRRYAQVIKDRLIRQGRMTERDFGRHYKNEEWGALTHYS